MIKESAKKRTPIISAEKSAVGEKAKGSGLPGKMAYARSGAQIHCDICLNNGNSYRIAAVRSTTDDRSTALAWAEDLVGSEIERIRIDGMDPKLSAADSIEYSYRSLKAQMQEIIFKGKHKDFEPGFQAFVGSADTAWKSDNVDAYVAALRVLCDFMDEWSDVVSNSPDKKEFKEVENSKPSEKKEESSFGGKSPQRKGGNSEKNKIFMADQTVSTPGISPKKHDLSKRASSASRTSAVSKEKALAEEYAIKRDDLLADLKEGDLAFPEMHRDLPEIARNVRLCSDLFKVEISQRDCNVTLLRNVNFLLQKAYESLALIPGITEAQRRKFMETMVEFRGMEEYFPRGSDCQLPNKELRKLSAMFEEHACSIEKAAEKNANAEKHRVQQKKSKKNDSTASTGGNSVDQYAKQMAKAAKWKPGKDRIRLASDISKANPSRPEDPSDEHKRISLSRLRNRYCDVLYSDVPELDASKKEREDYGRDASRWLDLVRYELEQKDIDSGLLKNMSRLLDFACTELWNITGARYKKSTLAIMQNYFSKQTDFFSSGNYFIDKSELRVALNDFYKKCAEYVPKIIEYSDYKPSQEH